MKTKHLILSFALLLAAVLLYPRLKSIWWIEPTKREWYGPQEAIESFDYIQYLPSGEVKELGDIYNAGLGWRAATFNCGILYHVRTYATKELAMRAIEKWCGAPINAGEREAPDAPYPHP